MVVGLLVAMALALQHPVASRRMLHPGTSGGQGLKRALRFSSLLPCRFCPLPFNNLDFFKPHISCGLWHFVFWGKGRMAPLIAIAWFCGDHLHFGAGWRDFKPENFRWWAIPAVLTAAILVALRDVATRYIGEGLAPTSVALTSALAIMILGWAIAWMIGSGPMDNRWAR